MVVADLTREKIYDWLRDVPDPEIPVLSITDLGIVRDISIGKEIVVALSPTYTGCPATEFIGQSVLAELKRRGLEQVSIKQSLSPPWTTDWITDAGRDKLKKYGIAPPERGASKRALLDGRRIIDCPRCESHNTELVSEFGSTACKAVYRCTACLEPFEYFKCI